MTASAAACASLFASAWETFEVAAGFPEEYVRDRRLQQQALPGLPLAPADEAAPAP